jgi:hypothetical protein
MNQKPKSQNADLAHLPAALAPLCQEKRFVLWRWQLRRDKWTKPPFMPNGANAETDNPATWSGHAAVVDTLTSSNGGYDGIGFVLRDRSGLAVVDLDNCLDLKARPDPWAQAWLKAINGAYVERTPSGRGLRIIGISSGEKIQRRWTIDEGRSGAAIEIYRGCNRYVTLTGAQISGGAELQPIDIDAIVAHYDTLKPWRTEKTKRTRSKKSTNRSDGQTDFNGAAGSIDFDAVIRNGAPNGQRSELFQACVWHLAAAKKTVAEIVALLRQYPNGIGAKYAGRLAEEVERSYAKWKAEREPQTADDDATADGAAEPEEPSHWDKVNKIGIPVSSVANARRAIRALNITCRRDAFHDRFLIEGKVITKGRVNLDYTVLELRAKIHKAFGFDPGAKNTTDALIQLCLKGEFDPVVDYLAALKWDNTPRLDRWLITYAGAADTELNREFGRIALIAAVRRARSPGCKFDPIIVLEGAMGTNKSKAIEILAGVENFSDQSIFGAGDREQQELLAGVWLYEIAELTNIRRTEVEHIKAFASRTHDRARPAYGHFRVDQPRRCVLFATTNNDQYLKEADRRFWPVRTTGIDIAALCRDRDQLWAEAAQREREGVSIVLRRELWDAARDEQAAREEGDPWDDKLADAIGDREQDEERISSADLLGTILGIHVSKQRDVDLKRLGKCMRRLGWSGPKNLRVGRSVVRGYTRSIERGNK